MELESQTKSILEHLNSGLSITQLDALNMFGCFRLSARIYDIKQMGYAIDSVTETDHRTGKRYARYSMRGE